MISVVKAETMVLKMGDKTELPLVSFCGFGKLQVVKLISCLLCVLLKTFDVGKQERGAKSLRTAALVLALNELLFI